MLKFSKCETVIENIRSLLDKFTSMFQGTDGRPGEKGRAGDRVCHVNSYNNYV